MPTRSGCCRAGASSSVAATSNCLTRKVNTRGCGRCSSNRRRPPPCSKKPQFCRAGPTEKHFTLVLGTTAYCLILFAFYLAVRQTATKFMLQSGHELPITKSRLLEKTHRNAKKTSSARGHRCRLRPRICPFHHDRLRAGAGSQAA